MKRKVWSYTIAKLLSVGMVGVLLYEVIETYRQSEIQRIAKENLKRKESLIQAQERGFRTLSDTLATLIFDQSTRRLMACLEAGRCEAASVRQKLWSRYGPIYKKLSRYHLRHFQFHTADGRSLLRVHNPDRYGDSLVAIRPSIATIVRTHQPLYGFEIGRYAGAYRALYPLTYKGRYVGSVELSFSFEVIRRALKAIDTEEICYFQLFSKEKLRQSAWPDQFKQFQPCHLDNRFVSAMIDRSCQHLLHLPSKLPLLPYHAFSAVEPYSDRVRRYTVVHFLPLRSISQELIGYYVIVEKENKTIASLEKMILMVKGLLIGLVTLIIALIGGVHIYRQRAMDAWVDPLTGIYNRRGCFARLKSLKGTIGLIMIDLDHFKEINDTYGHKMGDEVICHLVAAVRPQVRQKDIFCRYGGDEFMLFVSVTKKNDALQIAHKIHNAVAKIQPAPSLKISVSIGVAVAMRDESITSLITRADRALYRAKEHGRNRIEYADY